MGFGHNFEKVSYICGYMYITHVLHSVDSQGRRHLVASLPVTLKFVIVIYQRLNCYDSQLGIEMYIYIIIFYCELKDQ